MMFFPKWLVFCTVFSMFRPREFIYRSDPYSSRLAYGIVPFGPIECKQ